MALLSNFKRVLQESSVKVGLKGLALRACGVEFAWGLSRNRHGSHLRSALIGGSGLWAGFRYTHHAHLDSKRFKAPNRQK